MKKQLLVNDIKSQYIRLYRWIFFILPYVLLFIIAVLILVFISINNKNEHTELASKEDSMNIITNLDNADSCFESPEWIEINICNGQQYYADNSYKSINNQWIIKWRSLLKNTNIEDLEALHDIEYFALNSWYNVTEFENLVKEFVFKAQNTNAGWFDSLPIQWDLYDFFSISCVKNPIYNNSLCNGFVKDFINIFYIYDFTDHYMELKDIQTKINTNQINASLFCEWLVKHAKLANQTNSTMDNMIKTCSQPIIDEYSQLSKFIEINNELDNGYISNKVYTLNQELNEYKLWSTQQNIFRILNKGSLDLIQMNSYLSLLENLLKNTDNVRNIYFDWTYWFNNYYVAPILDKKKHTDTKNAREIENIINTINQINTSSQASLTKGLVELLVNPSLVILSESVQWEDLDTIDVIQQQIDQLDRLYFLSLTDKNEIYDQNWEVVNIVLEWFINVDTAWVAIQNLRVIITMSIDNEYLYVSNINIDGYNNLSNLITEYSNNNRIDIFWMYNYLLQNANSLTNTTIEYSDMCDWVELYLKENLWETVQVISCNENQILIKDLENKYKIILEEWAIVKDSLWTNDIELTEYIQENLDTIYLNNLTFEGIISDIVSLEIPEEEINDTNYGSQYLVYTMEKFNTYFRIQPADIADYAWKAILDINISWIDFIISFDYNTDTITQLLFKNMYLWNRPLEVKDFELTLSNDYMFQINNFIWDPIEYIKNNYPNSYIQYLQADERD